MRFSNPLPVGSLATYSLIKAVVHFTGSLFDCPGSITQFPIEWFTFSNGLPLAILWGKGALGSLVPLSDQPSRAN